MESFREISKFGKRLSLSGAVQSFYYHLRMYVVVQSKTHLVWMQPTCVYNTIEGMES